VRLGRGVLALGLLASGANVTNAGDDPCAPQLSALTEAVEAIGAPAAGEVMSARTELSETLDLLRQRANLLREDREATDDALKKVTRERREWDDKMRRIEFDQKVHDADEEEWLRDVSGLRAEKAAFELQKASAMSDEDAAAVNERAERGNARLRLLEKEEQRLKDLREGIDRRRAELAADVVGIASRANALGKRRARIEHETGDWIREALAAQRRAIALSGIRGAPARAIDYHPPSEVADKVVGDLFKALGKEAALIGLEGKTMFKVLAMVGLEAEPVGAAYSAADTLMNVGKAGVEQRGDELSRDLLLVGDYAAAMKAIVQQRKSEAVNDPRYVAMHEEVQRIADSMPGDQRLVLLQGFGSAAALGEAFRSALGQYVGEKVGHATAGITKRLDAASRAVHGKAGLVFFDRALKTVGKAGSEELTKETLKESAHIAADQLRSVDEARTR
jgi:hypothetical protein